MLILRRKEGQWVEITHRSGDVIRVRVCNVRARYPGQVDLALDDAAHNFVIQRPERVARVAAAATATAVSGPFTADDLAPAPPGDPGAPFQAPAAIAGALCAGS
jgi:hypothetical protein